MGGPAVPKLISIKGKSNLIWVLSTWLILTMSLLRLELSDP